jgi:hypothetical protein
MTHGGATDEHRLVRVRAIPCTWGSPLCCVSLATPVMADLELLDGRWPGYLASRAGSGGILDGSGAVGTRRLLRGIGAAIGLGNSSPAALKPSPK